MGKFRILRFLAAALLLAGTGNAFAEGSLNCMFDAKPCEDLADSSLIYQLPDSVNTTLQAELDRDTSFVFYGTVKKSEIEAYLSPYTQQSRSELERQQIEQFQHSKYGNTVFGDSISEEYKERFATWAMPHIDTINARLESSPKDLQTTFRAVAPDIDYALLKLTYDVKKVYDRGTKKWIAPADSQKTYTRRIFVRRGVYVVTDPIGLRANRSAIKTYSNFDRIFTSNGNSTIVDEKKLDSLDAFASRRGTFVPQAFVVEVIKNMSPIYMTRIQQALVEGNKDVLRKTVTLLDSFSVKAEGSFVIGPVLNLSCQTRQFMNFYLGTYDDNLHNDLNCLSTSLDRRSNDGQIFVMLRDSVMAMQQSGELEKNLANLPSGDRAFWRIITAALSTSDQNKLNELIKANADSIKKINQRDSRRCTQLLPHRRDSLLMARIHIQGIRFRVRPAQHAQRQPDRLYVRKRHVHGFSLRIQDFQDLAFRAPHYGRPLRHLYRYQAEGPSQFKRWRTRRRDSLEVQRFDIPGLLL